MALFGNIHHLQRLCSEMVRLEKLSPLNDNHYKDYDVTKWAGEVSYKIDLPIIIKKLEENKNDLQNTTYSTHCKQRN